MEREREALQRRFDGAVLAAQQRSAVRAALLERRLEAASSELALAQQASSTAAAGGQGAAAGGAAARSRAASAADAGRGEQGGSANGSRRGSRVPGPADWVAAMLEAALHTPLPDGEAAILEDDEPRQILQQIAELEAAEAEEVALPGGATTGVAQAPAAGAQLEARQPGEAAAAAATKAQLPLLGAADVAADRPLAAMEAKLSQAALSARGAAAEAGGEVGVELCIAAHRGSQTS